MAKVPEGRTVKPRCCLWRLKALALLGRDSVEWEQDRAHHHRWQLYRVPPARDLWEISYLRALEHHERPGWQSLVHRGDWERHRAHHAQRQLLRVRPPHGQ